jgi:hypothetical protein
MPTLIAGVVAVVVIYSLLQMFRAANPVVLARVIKIVGGVVALAVAAFTGLRGELAVAAPGCSAGRRSAPVASAISAGYSAGERSARRGKARACARSFST